MAITVALKKRILEAYETPGHPVAFSAPKKVSDFFGISEEQAKDILQENDSYTLHREYKKPRTYNPIYVHRRREQVQGDLIDIKSFKNANRGIQYLSLFIDIFTKRIWLYPLKNKTGIESAQAIKRWLDSLQRTPETLKTDSGSEYVNRHVQNILRDYNVRWEAAIGTSKAAVAERANKTIQILIYKAMTAFQTTRYFTFLDDIVQTYNNRPHRSLEGMTPNNADLIQNQAQVHAIHTRRYQKLELKRKRKLPLKIGDLVRIKIASKKVEQAGRAYVPQFHGEHFKIMEINTTMPIAMYYLRSENTLERIKGGFYAEELQKVKGELFKIEKIIRTEGKGRNKRHLVKWMYYGEPHNSWINARDIEQDFRVNR